jgi:hypothetical protein
LVAQKSPSQHWSLLGSQVLALDGPDCSGTQAAAHWPLLVQRGVPPLQVPHEPPQRLGPQLLLVQFGVQPHRPAVPPPPQVSNPAVQVPQLTVWPQLLVTLPQFLP